MLNRSKFFLFYHLHYDAERGLTHRGPAQVTTSPSAARATASSIFASATVALRVLSCRLLSPLALAGALPMVAGRRCCRLWSRGCLFNRLLATVATRPRRRLLLLLALLLLVLIALIYVAA